MALHGIDISSYQSSLDLGAVASQIDFAIVKGTQGTGYVNPYCDGHIEQGKASGLCLGVYHFADSSGATAEANYFCDNCIGYKGVAVPVLDWEGDQNVSWVNEWLKVVRDRWGVNPIIYANPWRFNQGGVDVDCGRWVASYPAVTSPTFAQAEGWDCPDADGTICAWQFASDGRLNGYNGNLDVNLFYGDRAAWNAYAGIKAAEVQPAPAESDKPTDSKTDGKKTYKVTGTFEVTEG